MLLPTSDNTKTVSDMRKDPVGLLKAVEKSSGPNYIFYRSTPKAVLLSIAEYEQLLDFVDDYYASLRAQEYAKEDKSKIKWITGRKMRGRLGLSRKYVSTTLSSSGRKAAKKTNS